MLTERKLKYFYEVSPIDFWNYWHKLEDNSPMEIYELWREMEEICKKQLNSDCPHYGVFYTAIPGAPYSGIIIAYKVENNGTTYVGSDMDLFDLLNKESTIFNSYITPGD